MGNADSFISGANNDIYLVKTDAYGTLQWSKTYGNTDNEDATCVRQTADGGYIICGEQHIALNTWRGFLIKTNSNGDTTWTKTYDNTNTKFFSVRQTNDGGYIAGGLFDGGTGSQTAYLVRTDNIGNVLWAKNYNPFGNFLANLYTVVQTSDGGFIAGGFYTGSTIMYVLKVNSAGDTLWSKHYSPGVIKSIQQTNDGGYILGGYYIGGGTNIGGSIIKTNSTGGIIWSNVYGYPNGKQVNSIQENNNGEFIAVLEESADSYFLKLNNSGNTILWSEKYLSTGPMRSIQQSTDGGYILVGGDTDVNLIKTDSAGLSNCNELQFLMSATNLITSGNVTNIITSLSSATNHFIGYVNSPATISTTLCSMTVGIDEKATDNLFSIYPNPTNGQFTIVLADNAEIIVRNVLGQQVIKTKTTQKTANLQLDNNGVYLVYLTTSQGTTTRKLIVNR